MLQKGSLKMPSKENRTSRLIYDLADRREGNENFKLGSKKAVLARKGLKSLWSKKKSFSCLFLRAAAILLLISLLLVSSCGTREVVEEEAPIEPLVFGQESSGGLTLKGRFAVVSSEMEIFALDVSFDGGSILFSSETCSVNMLDEQGRLAWDLTLEEKPIRAALAQDGRFVAVGTDGGRLIFLRQDGRIFWETQLDGRIGLLKFSPDGEHLAVSIQKEEIEGEKLYLFNHWGIQQESWDTPPILELFVLPGGDLGYLEKGEEANRLVLYRQGKACWEREASLAAFSGDGKYAAVVSGKLLSYYCLEGEEQPPLLWERHLIGEPTFLYLTEMGSHVLAYSAFSGGRNNLFLLNREGSFLWEKRIPDGSLIQVSCFGEKIAAASWQEYSDDFSKVMVLDTFGRKVQEAEIAIRIEKIALSGDGRLLVVAGREGNIFILDISPPGEPEIKMEAAGEQSRFYYKPVAWEKPPDENYITLYFYDHRGVHLIPVHRSVKAGTNLVQVAIQELVKGPRRLSGLSRTIPKDAVITVTVDKGLAFLNLPEELNRLAGRSMAAGAIDSLLLTLSQFPSIHGVHILIDGQVAEFFGADKLPIGDIFSLSERKQKKPVLYLPYLSVDRYYLLPREGAELNGKKITAEELVNLILGQVRHILPVVPRLKGIEVLKNEIILDWSSSFQQLFPAGGGEEEKLLAALFMDSLLLTLGNNLEPDRLVILVEGELWTPPEGYSLPDLQLRRPYYINPE